MSNMSKYAALHLVASIEKEAGKGKAIKKANKAAKALAAALAGKRVPKPKGAAKGVSKGFKMQVPKKPKKPAAFDPTIYPSPKQLRAQQAAAMLPVSAKAMKLGLGSAVLGALGYGTAADAVDNMKRKQLAEAIDQYSLGTGAGALGGAGLGAAIADNPWEGALYGGLAGAPVGAGATYLARLAKEKGWV